ncbi:hypothetical protein NDU88_002803 [Pleurodeles waltl]|uniref:Uncharacterized protein n=1 Tax=Pleurodeles waltl TaxID=8319 RepID=A0AAV7UAQ2_PLEWA|nr:hypothetical protein NDU88_002803 [Pleurodeles waltl]
MAASHEIEPVRATLCILGEASRSDLLRLGILDQAHGVAAAVAPCRSPSKGAGKKVKRVRGHSTSTHPSHGVAEGPQGSPSQMQGEGEPMSGGSTGGPAGSFEQGLPQDRPAQQAGQGPGGPVGLQQPLDLTVAGLPAIVHKKEKGQGLRKVSTATGGAPGGPMAGSRGVAVFRCAGVQMEACG